MYSNYVERRPFEGLLCKYNHACAWLPIVFAFHPFVVSFAALLGRRLPSRTAALQSVAGEGLGRLGGHVL